MCATPLRPSRLRSAARARKLVADRDLAVTAGRISLSLGAEDVAVIALE